MIEARRKADGTGRGVRDKDPSWSEIAPVLDEALSRLKTKDRDAAVLRFFEGKSFVEVGRSLGLSENAARMRVSRALARLRVRLARSGVAPSLAALASVLAARSVEAAPPELANSCATLALSAPGTGAAAHAVAQAKGAMNMMWWAKVKTVAAVIAAGLVMAAGVGIAAADYGKADKLLTPEEIAKLPPPPTKDIPVRFTLEKPGYVTIVIEDEEGRRVRNLIQDTYFEAGSHTVYWDGYDVGTPIYLRKGHGFSNREYDFQRRRVEPGTYRLRGLVHGGIRKRCDMVVQGPGDPPWPTTDNTGGWLGDHTPQTDCLFLPDGSPYGKEPQIMISCTVAEGGHGIIWVDEKGKKLHGTKFGWNGALAMARDTGAGRDPAVSAYALNERKGTMTLHALRSDKEHALLHRQRIDLGGRGGGASFAVHDAVAAISVPAQNQILFVDTRAPAMGKKRGEKKGAGPATVQVPDPKGLLVDEEGRLLVASGTTVKRFDVNWKSCTLKNERTLIASGLEDPRQFVLDSGGNLYVSDWGGSHQVKVFTSSGKPVRKIGRPGGQVFGIYDERRMCNPNGMAVDSEGKLWVAETTYAPKRTSVWDGRTGQFIRAFYGPPKYSAGGTLDQKNRNLFYYTGRANLLGIEFELDWRKGEARPKSIYSLAPYLKRTKNLPRKTGPAELPVYIEGKKFMVSNIGGAAWGPRTVVVWEWFENTRTVEPIAVIGYSKFWREVLGKEPLASKFAREAKSGWALCAWSDLNRDGEPQPEEVSFADGRHLGEGFTHVQSDLSMFGSDGAEIGPPSLNDDGVPVWDLTTVKKVATFRNGDAVGCSDGFRINTRGHIEGWKEGRRVWEYPAQYPNRAHGPIPQCPGHLVKSARVIGPTFKPRQGEAGEVWGMIGDYGNLWLFTSDGLYITDLGGDQRVDPPLGAEAFERGMYLGKITWKGEHWWATATQFEDTGEIYMQAGKAASLLFKLEGFEAVRRKVFGRLAVTATQLRGKPESYMVAAEWKTKKEMDVAILPLPPKLDGNVGEWREDAWVVVDAARNIQAAVAVSRGTLYAAYRLGDPRWLENSLSDGWDHAFATGGGLDLMIRTRPGMKPVSHEGHRTTDPQLASGDVRVFVTRSGDPQTGRVLAVRFEQSAGSGVRLLGVKRITYTSPVGSVTFDSVADVSGEVRLAQRGGTYELAIPLPVLGIGVRPGVTTSADMGVLVGGGGGTQARLYWAAGAGGMVSDVPTEAKLVPRWWGKWTFVPASQIKSAPTGSAWETNG